MKALVAIVGRPNVGKSTLFNRLVGSRKAIVDDYPGVTRDRNYADADVLGHVVSLIDTGGFEPSVSDEMFSLMRQQATLAIQEADAILFVVDAREGVMPADHEIMAILRETDKPVLVLANKVEGRAVESASLEAYELGTSQVFPISAEHGVGVYDVLEALANVLPQIDEISNENSDGRIKIAVIGRPNVGKSSIVNRLLGEERMLASDIAGTTRDSIDSTLDVGDERYLLIDTAGMRRKRSISMRIEQYSVVQAIKSLEQCDVALLVLDATQSVTDQDARLARLVDEKGKGVVVLVNKWDLVEKDSSTAGAYVKEFRDKLPFFSYAPVLFISAQTGQRAHRILDQVRIAYTNNHARISTGVLNRFFEDIVAKQPPPTVQGKTVKLYFLTQVAVAPPTIVAACNHPELLAISYQRYLVNQVREHFSFEGAPLRILIRPRSGSRPKREKGKLRTVSARQ
ncbi:MAG: ribosome biogenesis GTPase Der [Myxococcales bacterium]|nr:ribosome biogenesis GTPase Der [Myxococcales bacterium]